MKADPNLGFFWIILSTLDYMDETVENEYNDVLLCRMHRFLWYNYNSECLHGY